MLDVGRPRDPEPRAARTRPSSVPITATRLSVAQIGHCEIGDQKTGPIYQPNRAGKSAVGIEQWPQQRDLPLFGKRPASSSPNMQMARIARITARILERLGRGDVAIEDAVPTGLHDNAVRIGAENAGCCRDQHGAPLPFGHAEPGRVLSPLIRQNAQRLIDSGKLPVQLAGKQDRSILSERSGPLQRRLPVHADHRNGIHPDQHEQHHGADQDCRLPDTQPQAGPVTD